MKVGDKVFVEAKVVAVNHGLYNECAKLEIDAFSMHSEIIGGHLAKKARILINQPDKSKVIVDKKDDEIIDQAIILNPR